MRAAVAVLVVLVLGAACSDDPDRDAPSSAPITPAPATTTTTSPPASDDERVARDLVVRQADFPTGWNHSQAADQVEDPADRCLKTGPLAAATARAESDEFAKTDLATASSVSLVFRDAAAAQAAYAYAVGPEMTKCFDEAFRAELAGPGEGEGEEGVELSDVVLSRTEFPGVGEQSAGYDFSAKTSGTDQPYSFSANLVVFRSGRVVAALAFGNLGDPIPAEERRSTARNVAGRAPR